MTPVARSSFNPKEQDVKLTFAFQNLSEITENMIPKDAVKISILDLTENNFTGSNDLKFLFNFPNLKTLILDKNKIKSNPVLPLMENLSTLWVNDNQIENLVTFIENVSRSCPNLKYLSMMKNLAAPSYFNGGSLEEYNDYRLYVISKIPNIQMLDSNEVTLEERSKSVKFYGNIVRTGRTDSIISRKKSSVSSRKSSKKKRNSSNSSSERNSQHILADNLSILPDIDQDQNFTHQLLDLSSLPDVDN